MSDKLLSLHLHGGLNNVEIMHLQSFLTWFLGERFEVFGFVRELPSYKIDRGENTTTFTFSIPSVLLSTAFVDDLLSAVRSHCLPSFLRPMRDIEVNINGENYFLFLLTRNY